MLYPINTLKKSNRTRNDQGKSKVVLFCISVEYRIKDNLLFLANTKYISSHAVKISANTDFFFTALDGIHLKKVNILHTKFWKFHFFIDVYGDVVKKCEENLSNCLNLCSFKNLMRVWNFMKIIGNNTCTCTLFIKLSSDTKSIIIFWRVVRSKFSCKHVNTLCLLD